jgi:hypothetical protein
MGCDLTLAAWISATVTSAMRANAAMGIAVVLLVAVELAMIQRNPSYSKAVN